MGQICGSLLTALISDEFGRKAIATSSCLPALIGWLCIGLAYNKACLLAGRFFVRIFCTHYGLLRNFLFPRIGRPWNGVRRLHPFTVCFWTDVQTLQRPICNFWSNYHYSGHLACLCDWLISSVACNEDWTLTYTYLLHGSTKCCRSDLLELDLSHLKTAR